MPNSFKTRLKQLAFNKKLVLIGSALVIIGVFLPWYQDIDRFRIGDTFLGITGPLYLAGFLVLLAGVASFGLIMLKLLEKPQPKLPLKEGHFYISVSALSVFLLIISASVYFHPKFGVNLTDKSVGIGMILDFIGSGIVLLGAILALKSEDIDFNIEGELKPLINIDVNKERHHDDLELDKKGTVGDAIEKAKGETRIPFSSRDNTKAWGPVQETLNNFNLKDPDGQK